MSHQDVPFDLIVDAVRPPRWFNYNPLFQIMFATFRAAVQSRQFGQLAATPYVVESNASQFDLSVNIIEGNEGAWWVQAEYSTELFDDARVARTLERIERSSETSSSMATNTYLICDYRTILQSYRPTPCDR